MYASNSESDDTQSSLTSPTIRHGAARTGQDSQATWDSKMGQKEETINNRSSPQGCQSKETRVLPDYKDTHIYYGLDPPLTDAVTLVSGDTEPGFSDDSVAEEIGAVPDYVNDRKAAELKRSRYNLRQRRTSIRIPSSTRYLTEDHPNKGSTSMLIKP